MLAPASTIAGFRRWVVEECPIAPGRKAARTAPRRHLYRSTQQGKPAQQRRPGKRARMIAIAADLHDLATLPLNRVSKVANAIGAEVSLSPGTARRVLLAHVRALQNGHPEPDTTRTETQP